MNYVERMITTKIAEALCAANLGDIIVDSERGYDPDAKRFPATAESVPAIVAECDEFDEVHIFVGGDHESGYGPYVYLIFGNGNGGWDVMSDWIISEDPARNLDAILKPVVEFVEKEGS